MCFFHLAAGRSLDDDNIGLGFGLSCRPIPPPSRIREPRSRRGSADSVFQLVHSNAPAFSAKSEAASLPGPGFSVVLDSSFIENIDGEYQAERNITNYQSKVPAPVMAYTEPARFQQDAMNSRYLSSSLSGLSHSRSTNSLIVRTYKQATQLYLTKRFREALDTLESIVSPPPQSPEDQERSNGVQGFANGVAPVAQSSKGTRTKVWVFYLSLIHAIVELGVEEGKVQFGSSRWRQIAAKAREGSIWEEVVRYGYSGEEAVVDPDVVVNLATLLLGHMQSQKLNQQRLESYLASSAGLDGHFGYPQDGLATPMSIGSLQSSSPRDLATRLRILELYALHVLPANDEWDYAESFIEMNDTLDEERRETFLLALQGLKDEKEGTAQRERELEELREREMEERREAEEAKRKEEARKEEERRRAAEAEKAAKASNSGGSQTSRNTSRPAATNTPKPPPQQPRSSKTPKKNVTQPPANILARASLALSSLQQMILQASKNLTGNNIALARFLVFIMAFLLLLTRKGLRMKVKKAIEDGWVKVRQTVGMGVKVSYI